VLSDDLTLAANNPQANARGPRLALGGRRWLATLLLLALVAIAWEGSKALFNISD